MEFKALKEYTELLTKTVFDLKPNQYDPDPIINPNFTAELGDGSIISYTNLGRLFYPDEANFERLTLVELDPELVNRICNDLFKKIGESNKILSKLLNELEDYFYSPNIEFYLERLKVEFCKIDNYFNKSTYLPKSKIQEKLELKGNAFYHYLTINMNNQLTTNPYLTFIKRYKDENKQPFNYSAFAPMLYLEHLFDEAKQKVDLFLIKNKLDSIFKHKKIKENTEVVIIGIGDESDPVPPIQNDPHSPKLN